MPSNDLVLNVRQIAGYDQAFAALPTDSVLLQRGLGGPYLSIAAADLVGTALAQGGGDMAITGTLTAFSLQGGAAQFTNAQIGVLAAQQASFRQLNALFGSIAGVPIATADDISSVLASTVLTFNGRQGNVCLSLSDIEGAGGAALFSPRFRGSPRAPTADPCSSSTRVATTAWVQRHTVFSIDHLLEDHPFVFSFNGRTGDVTLQASDLTGISDVFNDVVLTGSPTAPTPAPGDDSQAIATTAFVTAAIAGAADVYAPIDSPTFIGYPSGPTAAPGSATGQLATTAFVQAAITAATAGVATFNGRTGAVTLEAGDITGAGGALLYSPAFTNNPTAPTQAPGTSNTTLATTAFVMQAVSGGVESVASFNGRTGAVTLTTGDVTGAGGAPIASPTFTGVPAGPTATAGTATTQLATTAFVTAAIAAAGGVASFNGRTGAITLTSADVSAAGGLTNPSVVLTGTPTAPTAAPGTNTNQLATTAFVQSELLTTGGVDSFNGRAGTVVLTSADVNAAGGPYLPTAGGAVTGPLTAPTPPAGDNSTNVATTAWVQSYAAPRQNRNRLLNGAFNVDQWNNYAAITPASSAFVCDRWRCVGGMPAARFASQAAIVPTANPSPSFRSLYLRQNGTVTTGAATDTIAITQAIEWQNVGDLRWGTPYALPVTLSFWAQISSFPTTNSSYTLSGSIRNNGATRCYCFPFTLPVNTWTYVSITIPGDQAAAFFGAASLGTDGFLYLTFDVGSGANVRGPPSQWVSGAYNGVSGAVGPANVGAAGATLQLANIQLEAGTTATPFDWKASASDYIECQRYYYASLPNLIWCGNANAGTAYYLYVAFNQTMRATPTITTVGSTNVTGFPSGTPPSVGLTDTNGFRAFATATGTGAGQYFSFGFTANAEI